MLTATEHTLALLRASGPCTLLQVARELRIQCAVVDETNDKTAAFMALGELVREGKVEIEQNSSTLVFYAK